MEEETVKREPEEIQQREPYDKPSLAKHGDLKNLTSGTVAYPPDALGCTKLFI